MKPIKILFALIICIALHQNVYCSQSKSTITTSSIISAMDDFQSLHTTSVYRLILLSAILGVVVYLHQDKIVETVCQYPMPCLAASFIIGNYLIDTISKARNV